jgi:protoporphyrinogen oxidase
MWERTAADIRMLGGTIVMGARAAKIHHAEGRVKSIEVSGPDISPRLYEAEQFILSMPLRESVLAFEPALSAGAVEAAKKLRYRDFLTVALIVEGVNPFPDNWIYIHEPEVKLGRIQNFKNWSEAMIGRPGTTCLGLEYFCFEGDGLWTMSDSALIELGKKELGQLGLVDSGRLLGGSVVRVEKAYPVYDPGYQGNVARIRDELAQFTNLHVVGRNGMHKYNNQDHSMMTAMLAVRNLEGEKFNLWNVNTDAEYHEEGPDAEGELREDKSGRLTPRQL